MAPTDDITGLVNRLVSIHGEEGVCPTAGDWRAILALQGRGPIHILNLLKFRREIDAPNGPVAGAAAYGSYSSGVAGAFARVGGKRIFFGRVEHAFAFGAVGDWDAAIVSRYPSADALAQMWLDPEFIEAHKSRMNGLERSQVLVLGE